MLTDIKSGSMRIALQQIYVNCYVEYVVKNPLSPVEHPGGLGVNNELFEASLGQFVVGVPSLVKTALTSLRIVFSMLEGHVNSRSKVSPGTKAAITTAASSKSMHESIVGLFASQCLATMSCKAHLLSQSVER